MRQIQLNNMVTEHWCPISIHWLARLEVLIVLSGSPNPFTLLASCSTGDKVMGCNVPRSAILEVEIAIGLALRAIR